MKKAVIGIIVVIVIVSAAFFVICVDGSKSLALVKFQLPDSGCLTIICEVAENSEELTKGLAEREKLAEDRGMVFVYESPGNRSFWMKNTPIPLDIIFIAADGIVINVEEADVALGGADNKLRSYHSAGPAKWVVEINKGICARHGIGRGTRVVIEKPGT